MSKDLLAVIDPTVPRTAVPFVDDPDAFRFVVVGDRTGGYRPGVFEAAMAKVNRLRPDFVINIGDLIEGYTSDPAKLDSQWADVENAIGILDLPFFFVPGNHDLSNPDMVKHWQRRHGATYYRFVINDVLFLVLNTEDPPVPIDDDILEKTHALEVAMRTDPEATQASILKAASESGRPKLPGVANISEDQLAYVETTLAEHGDVRWTFVLLHRPAWMYHSAEFAQIEGWLADRQYTVVAGHEHYYAYEQRHGRGYFDLGTTGGVWLQEGPGSLDHVLWVTIAADGPVFANLRLDGILDEWLD